MTVMSCEFESHSLHQSSLFFLEIDLHLRIQTHGGNGRTSREQRESLLSLCRDAGDLRRKFFPEKKFAAIAQLVEHDLAKVGVASSSLVCRSKFMNY